MGSYQLKKKRLLVWMVGFLTLHGFAGAILWGQPLSTSSVASINNLRNAAYCSDTSVSANTITCSTAVGFTGYAAGQALDVLLANTVTGATTINVNGLGAKAVTYNGTNALTSSTGLVAGGTYRLEYDGTRFVLQGVITAASACPAGSAGQVQFYVSAGVCGGDSNFTWDNTGKVLAIGTRLLVDSVAESIDLNSTQPTAPSGSLAGAGAGNVDNGDHYYLVTFLYGGLQTAPGILSTVVTVADKTVNGQITVASIPTGPTGTTSRKLYRSKTGGASCPGGETTVPCTATDYRNLYLLTTIANNSATTFLDNVADASLSATNPPFDSTTGGVYWNGSLVSKWDDLGFYSSNFILSRTGVMYVDSTQAQGTPHRTSLIRLTRGLGSNAFFGQNAGNATLTGGSSTGIGAAALLHLTSGSNDTAVGDAALGGMTTGSRNTAFGHATCGQLLTGNDNVCLGDSTFVAGDFSKMTLLGAGILGGADGAVAIGYGVSNAVANSVAIGSNSTAYFFLPGVVGVANQASCWKTTTQLSYCDSVVGVAGACTCH